MKDWWNAIIANDLEWIKKLLGGDPFLLNRSDSWSETGLYLASKLGFVPIAEFLISAGSDVNVVNISGYTPLTIAIRNKHDEIVDLLLTAGADIHIQKYSTRSNALITASWRGSVQLVETFLDLNANVSACDVNQWTALMFAVYMEHPEVVTLLLDRNANINELFKSKKTIDKLIGNSIIRSTVEPYLNQLSAENVVLWKKCRLEGLFN